MAVRIDAGGAQLERSLLERLQEPLMHLVHNAIDHGIEAPGERGSKPAVAYLQITARAVGPEVGADCEDAHERDRVADRIREERQGAARREQHTSERRADDTGQRASAGVRGDRLPHARDADDAPHGG